MYFFDYLHRKYIISNIYLLRISVQFRAIKNEIQFVGIFVVLGFAKTFHKSGIVGI